MKMQTDNSTRAAAAGCWITCGDTTTATALPFEGPAHLAIGITIGVMFGVTAGGSTTGENA